MLVVSGGQTGVDRAALDAAMDAGIDVGGWCPRGRRAADGEIPEKYPLTETHGKGYQTRTKWNVCDSDATLILCRGEPTGGTALTIRFCQEMPKPYMSCQLQDADPGAVMKWLRRYNVDVLNIAGPRELKSRPVYDQARAFLAELFELMRRDCIARQQSGDANSAIEVTIYSP